MHVRARNAGWTSSATLYEPPFVQTIDIPADAGIGYMRRPALTIRMENQPGTGAATFRELADAGVNADQQG